MQCMNIEQNNKWEAKQKKKIVWLPARVLNSCPPALQYSIPTYWARPLCINYCAAEPGQLFECNFKRFQEGMEKRKLFLEHHHNICSYMYFIMQNSCSLKETFDYELDYFCWISACLKFGKLCVIYQTRETVFCRIIQTLRRELKIWCAVEYFLGNSRCLDSWWNTVLSVPYILPNIIMKIYAFWHRVSKPPWPTLQVYFFS